MGGSEATVCVVLVTAPDSETGGQLAASLVEERLAACVNVVPGVRSIYRWDGRVQDDAEVLLVVKTRKDRVDALAERIRALHPYDLPEVVALASEGGSVPYLEWVSEEAAP